MKLSHVLAAVGLALSAAAAQADVTATITAVSDYDFRGLTQTRQNPALQGSIDITGKSGWYLGAWGSNVDFGGDENVEVDLYGGFTGGETFPWDIGIIAYTYPQSNDLRDFPEIYASLAVQVTLVARLPVKVLLVTGATFSAAAACAPLVGRGTLRTCFLVF